MTDAEREELTRRFHEERLKPAAETLRRRGISFFSLGRDGGARTYYARRRKGESYIFELPADEFASELHRRWDAYPELAGLIEPLLELAAAVAPDEEDSGEVSPFIYAMF